MLDLLTSRHCCHCYVRYLSPISCRSHSPFLGSLIFAGEEAGGGGDILEVFTLYTGPNSSSGLLHITDEL